MKQLKGIPININEEILGRITLKNRCIFNRSNTIFVGDTELCKRGYAATITSRTALKGNRPGLGDVDIDSFSEGDVVLIDKNGHVSFLYEINARQNVIMATELCNHRCIMCPQPPIIKEKSRTEFNLKLISLFDKKSTEIGISGGEPTLVGDDLFLLVNKIKKTAPKATITILSNGVKFADKEYAKKLALCHHPDLQIDVPLYSDIASQHNRIVGAKTFYKTVQGLYNLALFNQKIGIRVVVHKQTYDRLPQLANYIYHNFPFVTQVAFMQMETTGLANKNLKDLWIDPYEYNAELREAVLLLCDRGMVPYIYNAQLCILPEDIRPFAVQSISDWKDIYLPECEGCQLKGKCAGFFASNKIYHSKYIKKVESKS